MTAHELRLWHWRRALASRNCAVAHEKIDTRWNQAQARNSHKRADFHIQAVQALNEVLGLRGQYPTEEPTC